MRQHSFGSRMSWRSMRRYTSCCQIQTGPIHGSDDQTRRHFFWDEQPWNSCWSAMSPIWLQSASTSMLSAGESLQGARIESGATGADLVLATSEDTDDTAC